MNDFLAELQGIADKAKSADKLDPREQAIFDSYKSETGGGEFAQSLADIGAKSKIRQRREQRKMADQASPEIRKKTEDVLRNISVRSDRWGAIEALRALPQEEQEEVMRLAPGVMQQLGDDRGNALWRGVDALWKGANESLINPMGEFIGGAGLSPEDIEVAQQLEGLRRQETAPGRGDDPWYERGAYGALEMAPFAVAMARGGAAGRAAGVQAPGLASAASGAAARGVFGAGTKVGQGAVSRAISSAGAGAATLPTKVGLPAITAGDLGQIAGVATAAFPTMYIDEYHTLKDMGMEDGAALRGLAGASALFGGAIESMVPDVFPGKVKLTQGVSQSIRQYLWEAAKKYPGELSEEGLQGISSGLAQHVAQYLDKNVEKKSISDAIMLGVEQMKEAALPMAFLIGAPAGFKAATSIPSARRQTAEFREQADMSPEQSRYAINRLAELSQLKKEAPRRLKQLQTVASKGFVSRKDAKKFNIGGEARTGGERMKALYAEIDSLEDKYGKIDAEIEYLQDLADQGLKSGRVNAEDPGLAPPYPMRGTENEVQQWQQEQEQRQGAEVPTQGQQTENGLPDLKEWERLNEIAFGAVSDPGRQGRLAAEAEASEVEKMRQALERLAGQPGADAAAPEPAAEVTDAVLPAVEGVKGGVKSQLEQQRAEREKAKAGQTPVGEAAPVEPKASTPTMTFKTERGSVYDVMPDGTTIRNKAERPEHDKEDKGVKRQSSRTVYVDGNAAGLSAAGIDLTGVSDEQMPRVFIDKDGNATLAMWNAKENKFGAAPSGRSVKVHNEPAVGRHPLELWEQGKDGGYRGMHAGNKIVEMSPVPTNKAAVVEPKPAESQPDVIDTYKKDPELAGLFGSDAGVKEGYTVEGHTRTVLSNWRKQATPESLKEIGGRAGSERMSELMEHVVALHDIGKPIAIKGGDKSKQHSKTLPILEKQLQSQGFSPKEITIAKTLVGNDVIGRLIQGKINVATAASSLTKLAEQSGLNAADYFSLQASLYKADASSYPSLAGSIFSEGPSGKLTLPDVNFGILEEQFYGQVYEAPWSERVGPKGKGSGGSGVDRGGIGGRHVHGSAINFDSYDESKDSGKNRVGKGLYLVDQADGDVASHYAIRSIKRILAGAGFKKSLIDKIMKSPIESLQKGRDKLLKQSEEFRKSGDVKQAERHSIAAEVLGEIISGRIGKHVLPVEFSPKNVFEMGADDSGGRVLSKAEVDNILSFVPAGSHSKIVASLKDKPRAFHLYDAMSKELGSRDAATKAIRDAGYDAIQFVHVKGGYKRPYNVTVSLSPDQAAIGKKQAPAKSEAEPGPKAQEPAATGEATVDPTEAEFDAAADAALAELKKESPAETKAEQEKPESPKREKRTGRKSDQTKADAAAKRAAAKKAMSDAMKKLDGMATSGVNPVIMKEIVSAALLYVEADIKTFKGYVEAIIEDFGDAWAMKYAPYLEAAWRSLNRSGDAKDPAGKFGDYITKPDAKKPAAEKVETKPKKDENTAFLKRFGLKVSEGSDRFYIQGDTRAWKETIKDAAKGHGGARYFESYRGEPAWQLTKEGYESLQKILRGLAIPDGATGSAIPDYVRDPQLRGLRASVDGRPDNRRPAEALKGLVSDTTQGLILAGEKFGIPKDILEEQIEDVGMVLDAHDRGESMFLLANEPGSGKTFVLGAAIRELQAKGAKTITYVTLREELIGQIKKDLAGYGIENVTFLTYAGLRTRDKDTKKLKRKPSLSDVLIFDEAHSIKNLESEQGAIAEDWIRLSEFSIFASATPFENPVQAKYLSATGVFDDLVPEDRKGSLHGFKTFATIFGAQVSETRDNVTVKWVRTATSDEDAKAAQSYLSKRGLLTTRRIRLPANQVDSRMVKVNAPQEHATRYSHLAQAAISREGELNGHAKAWVVNLQKRMLEDAKLQLAIQEADAALDRDRFPIIFVETKEKRSHDIPTLVDQERKYQQVIAGLQRGETKPKRSTFGLPPAGVVEVLDAYMQLSGQKSIEISAPIATVRKHFGKRLAVFTGSSTGEVTQGSAHKDLAAWRSGTKPVLLATMAKGGTGLSLHDTKGDHPTTQIGVNMPWTATQLVQVAQRSARYGLAGKAEIIWLFADNIPFDRMLAGRVGGRMADMGATVHGQKVASASNLLDWNFENQLFSEEMAEQESPSATEQADKAAEILAEMESNQDKLRSDKKLREGEKLANWVKAFEGSPREVTAAKDLFRKDFEKAQQNGVSDERLIEIVDHGAANGMFSLQEASDLKSRISVKAPWQMTREEYLTHRGANADMEREDFAKFHLSKILEGEPGVSVEGDKIVYRNEKGVPVGVTTMRVAGGQKVVDDTGVHPDYRRQGIATALYREAKKRGFDTGYVENKASAGAKHKIAVVDALAVGKPVPANVLADYPRLVSPQDKAASDVDAVPIVTADQIGDGSDGTYDQMHAGLASKIVQQKVAIGMKGIDGREYGIYEQSKGKWQLVSRPAKAEKTQDLPVEGKPFEFTYIRNTEKSPKMGKTFGQHREPAGRYMTQTNDPSYMLKNFPGKFESGTIRFESPLVIDFGGGYREESNWKKVLSDRFGGKTGAELSQAIRDAGFDGVITLEPDTRADRPAHTSEIVDLSSFKPKSDNSPETLLARAAKYRQHGALYNRNIAATAIRLEIAIEKGHQVDSSLVKELMAELESRLEYWGTAAQMKQPEPIMLSENMIAAGLEIRKTKKGWSVKGLPEEIAHGIAEELGGRKHGEWYSFRRDPTEAVEEAARAIIEENKEIAAAEASGNVRTRIGTMSPEMADAYEKGREARIEVYLEPILRRNEGIRELLGNYLKSGFKRKAQNIVRRGGDYDTLDGFDSLTKALSAENLYGLPTDSSDLLDLLANENWATDVNEARREIAERVDAELLNEYEEIQKEWLSQNDLSWNEYADKLQAIEEQLDQEREMLDRLYAESLSQVPAPEVSVETDLFGNEIKTPKPAVKGKEFESADLTQGTLFSTEGALGQMNLFPDDGVPDDMVAKSDLDNLRPWEGSSVEDENRWFDVPVTVEPKGREEGYSGKIVRVLNNGAVVEVKPDGAEGTFRVPSDRVKLLTSPREDLADQARDLPDFLAQRVNDEDFSYRAVSLALDAEEAGITSYEDFMEFVSKAISDTRRAWLMGPYLQAAAEEVGMTDVRPFKEVLPEPTVTKGQAETLFHGAFGKVLDEGQQAAAQEVLDAIQFGNLPGGAVGWAAPGTPVPSGRMAQGETRRIDMNFRDVTKRIPELQNAAKLFKEGKLTKEGYAELVDKYKPVVPYDFVPAPATFEDAMKALSASKREVFGNTAQTIPSGATVGLRLDIPAYKDHGVWVNSIHHRVDGKAATSYDSYSSVTDADFQQSPASQRKALEVATGEANKSPFAAIKGKWNPLSRAGAVKRSQEALGSDEWVQVGYDPERHSYFYNRDTMQPLASADEVIQIGPLVLARNVKYANQGDLLFQQAAQTDTTEFKKWFSEKALESAHREAEGKSRSKLIRMSIDDFLRMAETLDGPTPSKVETVSKVLAEGQKFSDLPYLGFTHDGKGNAKVTSHEGRHRAMALKARGVVTIPVRLHSDGANAIRWNQQQKGQFDRIKGEWPKVLQGQTSGKIAFPVADPAASLDQTDTPGFKKWFGDSKVVDADGKPLVVYHGTNSEKARDDSRGFDAFDPSTMGRRDVGYFGKGFYFSPNPVAGEMYAGYEPGARILPVYLSIQNPYIYERDDRVGPPTVESLRERGHDGIFVMKTWDGKGRMAEIVAFNPTQIKSATGNQGTFDPSNPSILYQADIDPDAIPKAVLDKMSRRLKSMGYDSRGAEDVKQQLNKNPRLLDVHEDWIAAYQFATGSETARKAKILSKKDLKNVNWSRLRELGSTTNFKEAGYIRPDGSLADLSGKREGGQPGTRSFDHREAGGTAGMQEVIAYGWVRMDSGGMLDIAKMPTTEQLSQIRSFAGSRHGEIFLDLNDGLGEWDSNYDFYRSSARKWSAVYPKGTNPQRILNDIKKFFGGGTPNTLFQRADRRWHSAARKVVEQKMGPKGTSDQVLAMLRKNGAKEEELEWSGLIELLGGKQSVTKAEVLAALDNGVRVEEVIKGGGVDWNVKDAKQRLFSAGLEVDFGMDGEIEVLSIETGETIDPEDLTSGQIADAKIAATALKVGDNKPKFGPDVNPTLNTLGGENYRELLITLPVSQKGASNQDAIRDKYAQHLFDIDYAELSDSQQSRVNEMVSTDASLGGSRAAKNPEVYRSSHFEEPNILAHIRFNERTDADGKRVLFIEEVQSDWHQAGRKKGYAKPRWTASEQARIRELEQPRPYPGLTQAEQEEYQALKSKQETPGGVPDAPFKKAWPMLAMKRAIQYAAENGFDRIAWTTGEQQADRYDLSKQVDRIVWRPEDNDFMALKGGQEVVNRTVTKDELPDVIGKEMADRLLGNYQEDYLGAPGHVLEGDNLKVGGEGMKAFYDKMLPSEVNKFIKKFGAKVGVVEVGGEKKVTEEDIKAAERRRDFDESERLTLIRERQQLGRGESDKGEYQALSQPGFDITPAMRESALAQGQPLFQRQDQEQDGNIKGWTKFISATQAIIGATGKADFTTFIHELFHPMRRFLLNRDIPLDKRQGITDEELQALEDYAGVKDGVWTVAAEEKAAKAWEQYWLEGWTDNLPVALKSLFEKIARWMRDVYQGVQQITGDELPPEVRALFDKIVQRGFPDGFKTPPPHQGPGAPPVGSESHPEKLERIFPNGYEFTAMGKEVMNYLRELADIPGMETTSKETVKEWVQEAETTLMADPYAAERLFRDVAASGGRPLNQYEVALLAFHYRKLANDSKAAFQESVDAAESGDSARIAQARTNFIRTRQPMTEFEEMTYASKSTMGRAFYALQVMLREDFTETGLMRRARSSNHGKPLNESQIEEMKALAGQIEELKAEVDRLRAKYEREEAETESKKQHEQAKKDTKPRPPVDTNPPEGTAPAERNKTVLGRLKSFLGQIAEATGFDTLFQQDNPYEGAAKAYRDLGVTTFAELMRHIQERFGMGPAAKMKADFKAAWKQTKPDSDIDVAGVFNVSDGREMTKLARSIQRELIEGGLTDRKEVIEAVREEMSDMLGQEVTEIQAMDWLSGYGQYSTPSQVEIEKLIRQHNSETLKHRQIIQLGDALARVEQLRAANPNLTEQQIGDQLVAEGLMVKPTGPQRDKAWPELRKLQRQYNDLKSQVPVSSEGHAGMLQTRLGTIQRGLANRILDLKEAIYKKERIDNERKPSPSNEDIDKQRKELAELTKVYREMFPKKPMTEEQRIKNAIRAAERSIAAMEKQIATHNFDKPKSLKVSSPELNKLEAQKSAMRAQIEALKALELSQWEGEGGATPSVDRKEMAIRKNYIASIEKRIAEYQRVIAEKDFKKKIKVERKLSDEELKAQNRLRLAEREAMEAMAKYHVENLKGVAKVIDTVTEIAHLSRAMMTSMDLSALMNQGALTALSRPVLASKVLRDVALILASQIDSGKVLNRGNFSFTKLEDFFTGIDSQQAEFNYMKQLTSGEAGEFKLKVGLALTGSDQEITKQEELFQGRWGKYFPGVAISGRVYVMMLNGLRSSLFDALANGLYIGGRQMTVEEGRLLASFVNVTTGRSDLKGIPYLEQLEKHSSVLNTVFFAARYVASRFQYLSMPFYLPFAGGGVSKAWDVKKAIYVEMLRTTGSYMAALAAVSLLSALFWDEDDEDRPTIGTDPTTSDYGKVKIGDTRIDFGGGILQSMVFMSRFGLGRQGDTVFGEGYQPMTRAKLTGNFIRTKLAPVPGFIWTGLSDWEDPVGNKQDEIFGFKVHPSIGTGARLFVPLTTQNMYDAVVDHGMAGLPLAAMSFLGVRVSTYGPKTKYLYSDPEERQKQLDYYVKYMTWDSPDPGFKDFLTPEEYERVQLRRENRKQSLVNDALHDPKREDFDSDENYEKAVARRDAAIASVKSAGWSSAEIRQLLMDYWRSNHGSPKRLRGGMYVLKDQVKARVRRIDKVFGGLAIP